MKNDKEVAADLLHLGASRILLQHGACEGALRHSEEALQFSDTPQNRTQAARVLGSVAYLSASTRRELFARFVEMTQSLMGAGALSAMASFNLLELQSRFGRGNAAMIRAFVLDLENGRLEVNPGEGPLQLEYDRFRVAWEES